MTMIGKFVYRTLAGGSNNDDDDRRHVRVQDFSGRKIFFADHIERKVSGATDCLIEGRQHPF